MSIHYVDFCQELNIVCETKFLGKLVKFILKPQ